MNKKPLVDFFEDALKRQQPESTPPILLRSNVVRSNSTPAKVCEVFQDSTSASTSPSCSPKKNNFFDNITSLSNSSQDFVASASTASSPYASPRNSITNLQPLSVGNSPITSPIPPVRSASLSATKSNSERVLLRNSNDGFNNSSRNEQASQNGVSQKSLISKPAIAPEMEFAIDKAILALTNPYDEEKSHVFRICILHIVVAMEVNSFQSHPSASTDASSFRSLLHPKLPINWKLKGRHGGNDALYNVQPQQKKTSLSSSAEILPTTATNSSKDKQVDETENDSWLAMFDEKWQNVCGSPVDTRGYFKAKDCILLSCPVASLIVSTEPVLLMHESAARSLSDIFKRATSDKLYPYLVLRGGKSKTVQTRQAVQRYLNQVHGFSLERIHWHGLSSTSDGVFVRGIARLWQALANAKL